MKKKILYYADFSSLSSYNTAGRIFSNFLLNKGYTVFVYDLSCFNFVDELSSQGIDKQTKDFDLAIIHKTPSHKDFLDPILSMAKRKIYISEWVTDTFPEEWVKIAQSVNLFLIKDAPKVDYLDNVKEIVYPTKIAPVNDMKILDERLTNRYIYYCFTNIRDERASKELLKAFYYCYDSTDNVMLILKIKDFDYSTYMMFEKGIQEMLPKKKKLPLVMTITDYLTDVQLFALYSYIDCFIEVSRNKIGETLNETYIFNKDRILIDDKIPQQIFTNRHKDLDLSNHKCNFISTDSFIERLRKQRLKKTSRKINLAKLNTTQEYNNRVLHFFHSQIENVLKQSSKQGLIL